MLEFRILGPLEVVRDSRPARLGGPKQRATLAILLLNANRVVPIDRLVDDLYAGAAPVSAVTQVQRQVSELRRALGDDSGIETRPPGYAVRVAPERFDLSLFECWAEAGHQALRRRQPEEAEELLARALGLWRGDPLADFVYEPFARQAIDRLEEMRLAALEQRFEAALALARHAQLVGELEELVAAHPLHERFRAQLMLALYRGGRQADALEAYREGRETLVRELGLEPTPALHELERAILAQDPSLDLHRPAPPARDAPERRVLVALRHRDDADPVLAVARRLASLPGRELIVTRLLDDEQAVEHEARALGGRGDTLGVPVRTAAFVTIDPALDVLRLGAAFDAVLVLLASPPGLDERVPDELAAVLERSPADVAIVAGAASSRLEDAGGGVFVPFGGGDHDWAALEVAAWAALAVGSSLKLVGTARDDRHARRDASRLLADASLAVQQVARVRADPVLAEPTSKALAAAVAEAALVVTGISPRWRHDGIGATRRALVRSARAPVVLVHRGPRPGGLAPTAARTRFTWSVTP